MLQVANLYSEKLLGGFSLKNISFTQLQAENLAIIGETGSGKSTLLKIISGYLQPKSGEILFNGKKVKGPNYQLVAGEKGIAYLSQHFELRNNYRMEELLQYANELDAKEASDIYKICRIDHLMKRNSYQLSGGEKQRLALARLLISKPTLLILDEPFSNIDLIHTKILKEIIEEVRTRYNIGCILTSHNPNDILPWADKIMVMQKGTLVQLGSAKEIFYNPINEYVAALFGSYSIITSTMAILFDIEFIGNKYVKPISFEIFDTATTGVKGIIKSIAFMGNYYEVTVLSENEEIKIHTDKIFEKGEEVFIKLKLKK